MLRFWHVGGCECENGKGNVRRKGSSLIGCSDRCMLRFWLAFGCECDNGNEMVELVLNHRGHLAK